MKHDPPEISDYDFGDGDIAFSITLPIAPFGETLFAAPDTKEDSKQLLLELAGLWEELWPKMLKRLQKEIKDYGVEITLGKDGFMGSIQRTEPGCYKADKADYLLSLEFASYPTWDFFLKGTKIVHFQPVF